MKMSQMMQVVTTVRAPSIPLSRPPVPRTVEHESNLQRILATLTPEAMTCLVLCGTFLASSIVRAPVEDIGAILILTSMMTLRLDRLNSLHLAAIALIGLVFTALTPQQLFFLAVLGLSGYVAVVKEGLMYWLPRPVISAVLNASIMDLIESPLGHDNEEGNGDHQQQPSESRQRSSSMLNPIAMLDHLTYLSTKRGLLFSSLPPSVRWALLPVDMREAYEKRRVEVLEMQQRDEENRAGLIKRSLLKTVEKVENTVVNVVSNDITWLTNKVAGLEEYIAHHPIVWWTEKLTQRSKKKTAEAFGPNHKKDRIGLLLVIATFAFLASGNKTGLGFMTSLQARQYNTRPVYHP